MQLRVVALSLSIHLTGDIDKPLLAAVALFSITAVPFVVSEVEAKRILLADTQLFVGHVVVPANEVNGVAKIVPVRALVTGTALIPIPGALLGL